LTVHDLPDVFGPTLRTQRLVSPTDFELETLEPRLLLDGVWDATAAPNGGDWNTAANWVGGVVPTSGQITIAGLNPSGQVTFGSGTATVANVSISSGSLNVTGGTLNAFGGVTVSAGATMAVTGGLFQLFGPTSVDGTLAVGGTGVVNSYSSYDLTRTTGPGITVSDNGIFNVYAGTVRTGDSTIELSGNGTLNVGNEPLASPGGPSLWVNNSLSPPNGGIHASGNSRILLGDGGTLDVRSLIKIDGTAGLTQSGGSFILAPGVTVDALASTKAVALDLQAGSLTGNGTLVSKNANFGVAISPSGVAFPGISYLIFEISDHTAFLTGARLDVEVFSVGAELLVLGVANAGAHTVDLSGLQVTVGGTYQVDQFFDGFHFPPSVMVWDATTTITARPASVGAYINNIPDTGYGFSGAPWGLQPYFNYVSPFNSTTYGLTYVAQRLALDVIYTFNGSAGTAWENPANWTMTRAADGTALGTSGIPGLYANVVIPVGFNPVLSAGYYILNSLVTASPLTITGGAVTLITHYGNGFGQGGGIGTSDGKTIPYTPSVFNGALILSGGSLTNRGELTFGSTVTATGGRFYNESTGWLRITGAANFGAGSFNLVLGNLSVATGASLTSASSFTVPYQQTFYLAGTVTTPTLYVKGDLVVGSGLGVPVVATLNGNLEVVPNFSAYLTLYIAGAGANQASRLDVYGTVAIYGTLRANYVGGYTPVNALYTGITAGGGFITLSPFQSLGSYLSLQFSGNQLILVVNLNSASAVSLADGVSWMAGFVRNAAAYFNLSSLPGSPNFPVTPAQLDTLFGISNALASFTLTAPVTPASTNAEIVNSLVTRGYVVDSFGTGLYEPFASPSINLPAVPLFSGMSLIAHYNTTTVLTGLTPLSGPQFNSATQGLLDGLTGSTGALSGALSWTASLTVSLVFGLDAAGNFVIGRDSAITLSLAGASTSGGITGTLNMSGQSVAVTGTASADLDIKLSLSNAAGFFGTPYVDADLSNVLRVTADGTAAATFSYAVGPLALSYGTNYTLTENFAARTTTVNQTATLTGTMNFPGLKTAGGADASLALVGAYSAGTWTLTKAVSDLRIADLTVVSGAFQVALTATSFAGTGSLLVSVPFLSNAAHDPAQVQIGVSFNTTAVTLTGSQSLNGLTVKSEGATPNTILQTFYTVTVGGTMTGNFGGALSGNLTFSAAQATFAPDAKYSSEITDTNADNVAFVLDYNVFAKTFTITADAITFTVPNILSFTLTSAVLTYDRNNGAAGQVVATFNNVDVELLNLKNVSATGPPHPKITVSQVQLNQDGFTLGSKALTLNNVKLGDFLVFSSISFALGASSFRQGMAATGSMGFNAAGGTLYPGQSALAVNVGAISGAGLDYSNATWAMTTATFNAVAGDAFHLSQNNVALNYQVGGATNQTVAALTSVVITSSEIGLLNSATVNLNFRADGVNFNFSLSGPTATIGDYLSFTGAALTATNFNFAFGATPGFSGTLGFSFGTIKFFPAAPLFVLTLGGAVSAYYNFSGGANPTGSLVISVPEFGFKIGGVIDLSATNVTITPTENVLVTIATATVSIEKLSDITGTLSNLLITQTGFTLGSLDLAAPPGQTSTMPGQLMVFTSLSMQIRNLGYDKTTGMTGTITVSADSLRLLPNKPQVDIIATNITGGYVVNASGVSELTITVGTFRATMNPSAVIFTATNLVITPESSTVVTIGSVTATVDIGGSILSGSGGNFAIHSDGSFVALPNFGVAFSTNTSGGLLRLPSWLPLTISSLGLVWPDFNNAPGDFNIVLSASVGSLNGLTGLTVTGSVSNLVISVSELRAGRMPILDLGGVAITISGAMFGGTVSGSLALGIMKFDASGHVIAVTDTTTPVARRIMYGALRASFQFSSLSGFSLSIGISELGPLNIYVAATTHILLDPASGLTLTQVAARVDFNTALPDFQDPTELRNSIFSPVTTLTDSQWMAELQAAVANQALAPPGGDFWSAFSRTMLIRGSASFRSAYSPDTVFRAEVSVLISTDGRMAIAGSYIFGNTLQISVRMYGDFTGGNVRFLFLSEQSQPTNVTIMGTLTVAYTRYDGTTVTVNNPADAITFKLVGSVSFTKAGVGPKINGTVELTFGPNIMHLKLSGSVSLPFVGTVAGLAGDLEFYFGDILNQSSPELYGALYAQSSFGILENLGVKVSGTAFFLINTSNVNRTASVLVPGQLNPIGLNLPANTLSIYTGGLATFTRGGVEWFSLDGGQYYEISSTRIVLSQTSTLRIGPASAPLLVASTSGFLQIDDRGIAGQMSMIVAPNTSMVSGTVVNFNLVLQINTTGQAISVSLPTAQTFVVSAAPTGVTNAVAGPYLLLTGVGTIELLNTVLISASDLKLLVGINLIQLNVVGTMALRVNGATMFTYNVNGGFQIDSSGIAAAFSVNLAINGLSGWGFSNVSFNSGFDFRLNTTGLAQTIGGISLRSGVYVEYTATMGFTVNGVTMNGTFTFAGGPTEVSVSVTNASLSVKANGVTMFSFGFSGSFTIYGDGFKGIALSLAVSLTTNVQSLYGFSLTGTFRLDVNTTFTDRVVNGQTVTADTVRIALTNATFTISGVTLTGDFMMLRQTTTFRVDFTNITVGFRQGSTQIFGFSFSGAFQLDAAGIAAVITTGVTLSSGAPASADIALQATFTLELNTTNQARSLAGVALEAGRYVRVRGNGTVTVYGVDIFASFTITADAAGYVEVTVTGNFYILVGSTLYFRFNVSGALRVGVSGVAAKLSLSVASGIPSYIPGIAMSGTFGLEVNTTGAAVTFANGVTLESGTYFRVTMSGTITLSGVAFASASVSIAVSPGSDRLVFTMSGSSALVVNGTTYFSYRAFGQVFLTAEGIYGVLGMQMNSTFAVPGVTYNLEYLLAINTTGISQGLQYPTSQGTKSIGLSPQSVAVYGIGSIGIGEFSLRGSFAFRASTDHVEMALTAEVNVFGVTAFTYGAVGVYSDGLALSLQLQLSAISKSFMTLTGTFVLKLNTTGRTVLDIAPRSYLVGVTGATLTLTVPVIGQLSLKGSLVIGVTNGVFKIEILENSPISISLFGYGTLAVHGYVDSNGNFSFTGSLTNLELGSRSVAGLAWGVMRVSISNTGFSASFTAYLFLLGQNVGFVSGTLTNSSFSLSSWIDFWVPGVHLRVHGTISLSVDSGGISGSVTLAGNLFDAISVSGSLSVDTRTAYYKLSVGFNLSVGDKYLGASLSGNVTVSSNWWENAISGSGSVWAGFYVWNPFGSDWWVGGSLGVSFSGSLAGKFSITFHIISHDWTISVDLSSYLKAVGSDIAGGYAFLDVNGDGIWQDGEARAPVDADGNFTFAVGDTSLWMRDPTNTFAFQDLNGNGVWDDATEARLALTNGELPAVLVPATLVPTDYAPTDPTVGLGLLQAYGLVNADGVAVLNPALGRVMVSGGSVVDLNTGHVTPNGTARQLALVTSGYTGLVGSGQVVFFDTNNNGILDGGEVSVTADTRGFFTFTPNQAQLANLGILAGFDANGNGRIDANEGSIVLAGGIDKNNGLPVETVIRMSAENIGNGLALVAQPLSALHAAVVLRGYDAAVVNTRLALVFGLPTGIDFGTVDVQTGTGLTSSERTALLRITSQLESYLLNAGSLLATAGVAVPAAQQAALNALVDRVLQNYSPATQGTIAPADMVDLTDLATLNALLVSAAAKVGVSPAAATRNAVAQVTRELNLRAAAYAATSSALTRDLARIDALAKDGISTDIGELAAGRITTTVFLGRYTGAALDALLAGVALTPVAPPTLTGVTNVTLVAGSAAAALNLHLATTTGIAANITLTAASGNTTYLANTAITIIGSGADRVLVIDPNGLGAGSTTVTVTATLDGQVTTQTLTFTVTSAAALVPDIASTPVTGAAVDQLYTYGFVAFPAAPGGTLVITAAGLPTWLTFTDNGDGTASLVGLPSLADLAGNAAASYAIVLTVTDNLGAASIQAFTLQLIGSGLSFPTFGTTLTNNVIAAGALFIYNIATVPGAGATSVAITASALPAWLTLTDHGDGTATLSGRPTLANQGAVQLTLTATDNLGLSSTQLIELAVFAGVPPVFAPIAGGTVTGGQTFTRVITVTPQAPATSVVITAAGLPTWLTFTDNGNGTGTLTGTPGFDQTGGFTVVFTATDDIGGVSTRSLTVAAGNTLSLAPIGNVTIPEDGARTVTLSLGGASSSSVLVVVTAADNTLLPVAGLVVTGSGATRTLTLTPAANASGTTTVTVTLVAGGLSVSQSFIVTVAGVDDPVAPTGLALPDLVVRAGSPNVALDLSAYFGSADGAVTYVVSGSDATLAGLVVTGNILAISPNGARSGVDLITVIASSRGPSGQIYTASGIIRLTVVPELTVGPAQVVRTDAGTVLRFTVTLLTPSNQTVRVGYATANGTAMAGVDFVGAAGTLEFAPGATVRTIDVALIGGLLFNPGNFTLGLSGAQNATVIHGAAAGTIPVDRGVLAGVRPPTLELSFSFIEFTGGTATENDDVDIMLAADSAFVRAVVGSAPSNEGAGSLALTGVTPGGSLVDATNLGALAGLREIPRY
jgi:hypothetical protein